MKVCYLEMNGVIKNADELEEEFLRAHSDN